MFQNLSCLSLEYEIVWQILKYIDDIYWGTVLHLLMMQRGSHNRHHHQPLRDLTLILPITNAYVRLFWLVMMTRPNIITSLRSTAASTTRGKMNSNNILLFSTTT